jgi:hypothetical protein
MRYSSPFVVKSIIVAAIFLGLGCIFFLQKQYEKKEALELKKRQEEAFVKARARPSAANSSLNGFRQPTPMLWSTPKPKPTPMLPKPTPMLPKPTPMLRQSP